MSRKTEATPMITVTPKDDHHIVMSKILNVLRSQREIGIDRLIEEMELYKNESGPSALEELFGREMITDGEGDATIRITPYGDKMADVVTKEG